MAEYYLPIKIGQRRMHICHLNNSEVNGGFEFVVPIVGNDVTLFSIDNVKTKKEGFLGFGGVTTVQPKIVAGNNSTNDVNLNRLGYEVTKTYPGDNETPNAKVLNIKIVFGKASSRDVPLKNDNSRVVVERYSSTDNFIARTTNQTSVEKINFTIAYFDKSANQEFAYSFVLHTPKPGVQNEIHKVAIDFGSEASQISFKNFNDSHSENIRLVNVLREFYPQYQTQERFWQGIYGDTDPEKSRLYKSVFFINRRPANGFQFHDVPNKHRRHTLLQTLAPEIAADVQVTDEESFSYTNLSLLPNLKLVELLPGSFMPGDIHFNPDNKDIPQNFIASKDMLSPSLITTYIRLILNNFMYTVLEKINTTSQTNKYLQVTLLMPNVYGQDKVYKLITHLYTDFRQIVENDARYSLFKGIEVQAMSESDASFVGARNFDPNDQSQKILSKTDAKYLVIDAGKGTTDFSIIRQQGNDHTKFESIFRTGLPGSGQYLSYAFIEALNQFLKKIGLLIHQSLYDIIYATTTEISRILKFMENIEELKKHYVASKTHDTTEMDAAVQSLKSFLGGTTDSNRILEAINGLIAAQFTMPSKRTRIPGSETVVDKQIDLFVAEIENCIARSQEKKFYQIVLAGRAFLFGPLREAVKQRLNNLATAENKFVFQSNRSKFICVEGAFRNDYVSINLNSELIGSPMVLSADSDLGNSGKDNTESNHIPSLIDEKFFYQGFQITGGLKSRDIRIGARNYDLPNCDRSKNVYNLFYTGNGFILRWDKGSTMLVENKLSQDLTDMVEATLFPFAKKRLDYESPATESPGTRDAPKPEDFKPREKPGSSSVDDVLQ